MSISGVSMAQSVYQYSKIAKYTSPETASVKNTADTVEISAEAMREAKISAFLKDKPYSTYKYEWMQRNRPDEANTFIDTVMEEYDLDRNVPSIYPCFPKERDEYARGILGYKTADDVRTGMEQGNTALGAQTMLFYLSQLDETKNTLLEDWKDLSIDRDADWPKSGAYLNAYKEDFSFYKDMKVDPETAEVWFLPKNSDEWMTKAEFEKAYPDYKASTNMKNEFFIAQSIGHDTAIKYIENYIAELSEEDKAFIKDLKLLSNPAFRNLDIDGLEQFTTTYEDVGTRPFMISTKSNSDWIIEQGKGCEYHDIPGSIRLKYAMDTSLTTEQAIEQMKQEWEGILESRLSKNYNTNLSLISDDNKNVNIFTPSKTTFEELFSDTKNWAKDFRPENYKKELMTVSFMRRPSDPTRIVPEAPEE